MPGTLKTDAIVLRSIRYGEADRILHLYTPDYGRVGAIAKGVRRARSRFGARLEPFFHVRAVLHEGRSELLTVTAADTVASHGGVRDHAATLDAAARACDAVARLFETADPHPGVFRLLANRSRPAGRRRRVTPVPRTGSRSGSSCCWPPASCRSWPPARCAASPSICGASPAPPAASSAAPVKPARSRSTRRPTGSWSGRSGAPLAQAPAAPERALRQVERAIADTSEHHAHVRLRPLLRRPDR